MKKEDFVYYEKYESYQKEFDYLRLSIPKEDIDNLDILEYANYIVNNYLANKEKMEQCVLEEIRREELDESDEEIISMMKKPLVSIMGEDQCQFWFDPELDELGGHFITVYISNYYDIDGTAING